MVIFLENLWCIYYYHEVPDEEKKELLLSWILPQFTTSQNLLHVISGELRKIGSSEQKIEMIFLLLQRALISYFSFSILSNFLANVINIRSNNKFLLLQFKQKFLFEKENKKWNNDWWKRKQTVPRVVNNTMMMIRNNWKVPTTNSESDCNILILIRKLLTNYCNIKNENQKTPTDYYYYLYDYYYTTTAACLLNDNNMKNTYSFCFFCLVP